MNSITSSGGDESWRGWSEMEERRALYGQLYSAAVCSMTDIVCSLIGARVHIIGLVPVLIGYPYAIWLVSVNHISQDHD